MGIPIPAEFRDLLDRPIVAVLVTLMPDGQPQATPLWVDYDGTYVRVNTARGRQKDRNMRRDARVTIISIDPDDTGRWIEIRGRIFDATEEGAVDHINALSAKYDHQPDFYHDKPEQRGKQRRVTYRIEPLHINTDG